MGQSRPAPAIDNGLNALQRAALITSRSHAEARFEQADLGLRLHFPRPVHTLDSDARRGWAAAGAWAARPALADLPGTLGRPAA